MYESVGGLGKYWICVRVYVIMLEGEWFNNLWIFLSSYEVILIKLSWSLVYEFVIGGLVFVFLVCKFMFKFYFGSFGMFFIVFNFENFMCFVMVYVECGEFVLFLKMVDNFWIIVLWL